MSNNFFLRWLGPGLFNGISLGQWLTLLSRNRWRIGLPYLARAGVISFAAAGNSVLRTLEQFASDAPSTEL